MLGSYSGTSTFSGVVKIVMEEFRVWKYLCTQKNKNINDGINKYFSTIPTCVPLDGPPCSDALCICLHMCVIICVCSYVIKKERM